MVNLQQIKAALEVERDYLQTALARRANSDLGVGRGLGDADAGTATANHFVTCAETAYLEGRLRQVETAIARIDAGTYGACEMCGERIDEERLLALPAASLCISCKQMQEKEGRRG